MRTRGRDVTDGDEGILSGVQGDAVALYLSDPSHTFDGISQDLGVSRKTLRNWVRAERKRSGVSGTADRARKPAPAGEVSPESVLEDETRQLKAQIRKRETEQEILRRAAKHFVGETNW